MTINISADDIRELATRKGLTLTDEQVEQALALYAERERARTEWIISDVITELRSTGASAEEPPMTQFSLG